MKQKMERIRILADATSHFYTCLILKWKDRELPVKKLDQNTKAFNFFKNPIFSIQIPVAKPTHYIQSKLENFNYLVLPFSLFIIL